MAKWDEISGSVDYKNLSTTDKSALRTEYFKRVIVPELETSDIESGYAEFMRRTEPSFTDKALDYVPEFMGGNKATGAEQEVATPPVTATKQENDWYAQAKRENPNAGDAEIADRMTALANAEKDVTQSEPDVDFASTMLKPGDLPVRGWVALPASPIKPDMNMLNERGFMAAQQDLTARQNEQARDEQIKSIRQRTGADDVTARSLSNTESMLGTQVDPGSVEDADKAWQRSIDAAKRDKTSIVDPLAGGFKNVYHSADVATSTNYKDMAISIAEAINEQHEPGIAERVYGEQMQRAGRQIDRGEWLGAAGTLAENPKGFAHFAAGQGGNLATLIGAGALGAVTGGVPGMLFGASSAEMMTEFGNQIIGRTSEYLSAHGKNKTPQDIYEALQADPSILNKSLIKAAGTTAIDMATTFAGMRIAARPLRDGIARAKLELGPTASKMDIVKRGAELAKGQHLSAAAKGMTLDIAGAGASEAIPQQMVDHHVDTAEVIGEMLLEPLFGAPTMIGATAGQIASDVRGQQGKPPAPTTLPGQDTSQKPDEAVPPRGYMTRDQIDAAANAELDRINLKAKGTPDQTINGPDGKPVVAQGEPAQLLSDEEKSIRDFIIANQGNHEKLAGAFGYGVARDTPVAPTTAPTGPLTSALAAAPVATQPVLEDDGTGLAQQAAPPTHKSLGFKEAFSNLVGGGVSEDFYRKAFDSLLRSKDTISGVRDPILARARAAFDAGLIKSPDDLRNYVQSGYPNVPPAPLQESTPVAASDDAALLARIQHEQSNDAIQADELLDEPITEKAPNGPSDLAAAPDYPDANAEDGDQVQSADLPGSGIAIPDAMPGLPGGDSSGAGVPVGDGAAPVQPSGGVEPGEALEQPAIIMETTIAKPDAYAKTFVELAKLSNEVQERIDALHNKLDGEGVSWDDQKNHPELESLYQKRVDIDTAAAQKGYDGARKVAEDVLSGMPHESPFSSIESILRERYSLTNNPQAGVYMMSKYTGKAIDNPLTIDETARDIQHLIVARDYPKADFDLLMDSQMSVLTRKSRDAIIRESINKAKELNDGIRDFFIADSIAAATPINAKAKLDALKAKQQSRLKPIDDARVPDMANDLREMAKLTGWAQEGGRMIRGSEDPKHPDYNKISRTTWMPRPDSPWYSGMANKLSGQDAIDAIDDAIAGRPMKVKAQRFVSELMDIIAEERKQAAETKSARLHFDREQLASEAGALGIDTTDQSAEQIKAAIDAIYAQYDQLEREALQEEVDLADAIKEEVDDIPFGESPDRKSADLDTIFGANWNEESQGEAQGPYRQETAPTGIAPAVPEARPGRTKQSESADAVATPARGTDKGTAKSEREGVAKDEAAPAFSLSGQTPEEVKAQEQDRLEQIKLEEAETKKRDEGARKLAIENERKGRVGIASDEYTLDATEGNAAAQKKADKARADDQFAGQGDIFAQPTPAKPKAQPVNITVSDIPPMILQQIMVKMPGHQQGEVNASEALETNRKAIEQMRNFMNCIKAN